MSEYDDLIEGFELAKEDPGPLTDSENQELEEKIVKGRTLIEVLGPLIDEADDIPLPELRILKSDQIPQVGAHYVIYEGRPMPVTRGNYAVSEDEHVRSRINVEGLKDHDGQRSARAERTLRMRYRGYLCGGIGAL